MRGSQVCLLVLAFSAVALSDEDDQFKLPSYVDVCYRDDPKVADCLKKDIEKLIPKFKSGSKDFDLASLDPLSFKDLVFDFKSAIIGGHLVFPEVSVKGLSKLKVTRIKPKTNVPQKFILDFDGRVPIANLRGSYNLSGNLLTLPINIDGFVDIVFEQVDMSYKLRGDVKTIGDYEFLDLKAFKFRFVGKGIKSAYVANKEVVRGRPALNTAVIAALNANWRIVMDNLLPSLFPVADVLMRDLFKDFFKKYPYDILFPRRTKHPKALR